MEIGERVFMFLCVCVLGGGGRVKDRCLLCVGMCRSVKMLKRVFFKKKFPCCFSEKPACEGHYL